MLKPLICGLGGFGLEQLTSTKTKMTPVAPTLGKPTRGFFRPGLLGMLLANLVGSPGVSRFGRSGMRTSSARLDQPLQ